MSLFNEVWQKTFATSQKYPRELRLGSVRGRIRLYPNSSRIERTTGQLLMGLRVTTSGKCKEIPRGEGEPHFSSDLVCLKSLAVSQKCCGSRRKYGCQTKANPTKVGELLSRGFLPGWLLSVISPLSLHPKALLQITKYVVLVTIFCTSFIILKFTFIHLISE